MGSRPYGYLLAILTSLSAISKRKMRCETYRSEFATHSVPIDHKLRVTPYLGRRHLASTSLLVQFSLPGYDILTSFSSIENRKNFRPVF